MPGKNEKLYKMLHEVLQLTPLLAYHAMTIDLVKTAIKAFRVKRLLDAISTWASLETHRIQSLGFAGRRCCCFSLPGQEV